MNSTKSGNDEEQRMLKATAHMGHVHRPTESQKTLLYPQSFLFYCQPASKAHNKPVRTADLHYDSCDRMTCSAHYVPCKQWWQALHTELARSFRQEVQPWHKATSHWRSAATKRPAPDTLLHFAGTTQVIRWIWRMLEKRQLYQGLDELVGALCQSHITLIKTNWVHSHTSSPPTFPRFAGDE